MRRIGDLWPQVASFAALCAAARRAARGKRTARSAAAFLERAEPECLALLDALRDGSWRPGPVARFPIRDPKPRIITVVPFRDQVVHHALMGAVEPWFDRRMIADSFACRRGKGTHAALARARGFLRARAYFLKLDVAGFFASVRHDVALSAVARVVKDRRVLDLFATMFRGPLGEPPTANGLPLGSLTSQWTANLVLDPLDRFVKETLRIPGYVRYMDDFVLFADERARLSAARDAVAAFLRGWLGLRQKDRTTILAPADHGLPFRGWSIHRGTDSAAHVRRQKNRASNADEATALVEREQWRSERIDASRATTTATNPRRGSSAAGCGNCPGRNAAIRVATLEGPSARRSSATGMRSASARLECVPERHCSPPRRAVASRSSASRRPPSALRLHHATASLPRQIEHLKKSRRAIHLDDAAAVLVTDRPVVPVGTRSPARFTARRCARPRRNIPAPARARSRARFTAVAASAPAGAPFSGFLARFCPRSRGAFVRPLGPPYEVVKP